MSRLVFLVGAITISGALVSCSPCARVANAEADVTARGKTCNASNSAWSSERSSTCEANLSKCSPEDTKWLDTYADCLNKIPACAEGQGMSYAVSRLACLESYLKVSGTCLSAIQ